MTDMDLSVLCFVTPPHLKPRVAGHEAHSFRLYSMDTHSWHIQSLGNLISIRKSLYLGDVLFITLIWKPGEKVLYHFTPNYSTALAWFPLTITWDIWFWKTKQEIEESWIFCILKSFYDLVVFNASHVEVETIFKILFGCMVNTSPSVWGR